MLRDLRRLSDRTFDLLVVGGGVTGAFVAREATRAGLATALVEQEDFAAGATGYSLNIIHGGLRHLARGDLGAWRRSRHALATWRRVAPHLVAPLPVVVPVAGAASALVPLVRTAAGLRDLIASSEASSGVSASPRTLSAERASRVTGGLLRERGGSALHFHDGVLYSPGRVVVGALRDAAGSGCVVANHARAEIGPGPGSDRREIRVRDRLDGRETTVDARLVVDATGAYGRSDESCVLAFNLVLPDLGLRAAVAVASDAARSGEPGARGRRRLLLVPWRGRTLAGTAYRAVSPADAARYRDGAGGRADPPGLADSARSFLRELRQACPTLDLEPDDVLAVSAALLPADRSGRSLTSPRLADDVAGGRPTIRVRTEKFTTAPLLAADVVAAACRRLGRPRAGAPGAEPLPGGDGWRPTLIEEVRASVGPHWPAEVVEHVARSYGGEWKRLLPHVEAGEDDAPRRVVSGAPVLEAQLRLAVEEEMALEVDDLLRRSELEATGRADDPAREAAGRILAESRRTGVEGTQQPGSRDGR